MNVTYRIIKFQSCGCDGKLVILIQKIKVKNGILIYIFGKISLIM